MNNDRNWNWGRPGFRGHAPSHRGFGFRGGPNYGHGNTPWRDSSSSWRGNRSFGRQDWDGRRYNDNRQNTWNTRQPNVLSKRLNEEDIGVTEYVSDHVGFNGIIKSRYSDFQVSEINLKGEIAKLTDLKPPEEIKPEEVKEDDELLLSKYNLELLPMETWDRINTLAVCAEPTAERVEVDVTGMDKEHRTKIHDAVKKAFGDAIVGSTVTVENKKLVRFEKYRKGVRIDTRVKWMWPGEYLHFIVYKDNCDTMEAANRIAERLSMNNAKPSVLGYAGTKDRRAKTSQWFSLRKVEPRRLERACATLRDIHVGNYRFSQTHIKLGMLKGNRFRIALRNVTADDSVVDTACEELKNKGFINYYGLQRFGTRLNVPTYDIGLKLLQGKYKEAINSILDVREGPMQPVLAKYRECGDAGLACRQLRRCHGNTAIELRLLRALARDPNDLVGALGKLARNNRLLYVHSYQSLIWNKCVTERIKRFGLEPAVGDLVMIDNSDYVEEAVEMNVAEEESEDEEIAQEETAEQSDTDKKANENGAKDQPDPKPNVTSKLTKASELSKRIPVQILTQEDLDSNKYTMFDVILPLPGTNIMYPPNMKEFYDELLTKDSVSLQMQHKLKCYRMSGTYRRVIIKPADLEWQCVHYNDPYGDLLLSDYDEMRDRELNTAVPDGKFKALLLTMSLPASCYATMTLRELLRADTSGDNQALQNNYHMEAKADAAPGNLEVKPDEKRKIKEEADEEVEVKKIKLEDE